MSVKSFEFEKLINYMVNINSHFLEVNEMWFSKSIRLPMTALVSPFFCTGMLSHVLRDST